MKVRVFIPMVVVAATVLSAGPASHAQNPPPVAPGLVTMTPTTAGDRTTLAIRVTTASGTARSRLNIEGNPEVVVLNELDGLPLDAGEGCRQLTQDDTQNPPHRVACVIDKKGGEIARTLAISLGDGPDLMTMDITGPDVTVDGGAGDDTLLAKDEPYPGYGLDDTTYPHPKANVQGGEGNDTIIIDGRNFTGAGNADADTMELKGLAGAIIGGAGPDRLTLLGFKGVAFGGSDVDVLNATKGTGATLNGGSGDDSIKGSPGDDDVVGGLGSDLVLTGAGKDKILLRDGVSDRLNCGSGKDVVTADGATLDKVFSCEQIRRPPRRIRT